MGAFIYYLALHLINYDKKLSVYLLIFFIINRYIHIKIEENFKVFEIVALNDILLYLESTRFWNYVM